MNANLFHLLWFWFFLSSAPLIAQKSIENQHLLWVRYDLRFRLPMEWQIRQEFEERSYWFPWRQHQFVSRTHLEKKIGQGWTAGAAYTLFFQTLPQDPESEISDTKVEWRPQIELTYDQDISPKFKINHRYWSEFRFFENESEGHEFGNMRFRYKLELRFSPIKSMSIRAFDEVHFNIGKRIINNTFDQNRYGVALLYMPHDTGMEIGYINWFQQRPSGEDYFNRHILRFTFYQSFSIPSKS